MNINKLLEQVCEGEYERVEKTLENQIKKINEIKFFCKTISFVREFSYQMREHHGKKISYEIGHETDRFPQASTLFYKLDGKPGRFQIEDGTEYLGLLSFSKRTSKGEFEVNPCIETKMLCMILDGEWVEKYGETCERIGVWP